ncbi:chromosome segregation protein SMC [Thermocrinis albus DSM 14484]|uniref:Chromosome partition protein Smc n=1 Tax=Thermocrinis albus (strain DSM 14484 / JCM 11386 / HI 11/12) TaxID=638303 RepID=D3SQ87_THEAH|nr:chromosome segregation protein SMC [Thermocrinis albus]ADC89324.1 chromosome segregation protein SMC [Thermocrinis albus DSM 14484]
MKETKGYIEKIVVEGFKSYGMNRLEIPLGEGFTAIVGPNGSGKSNIGDAISFALGIATARMLRAKNLSYLIHTKDGQRAPYAYVEVHFNNFGAFPTEDSHVVISRKVYPDGRSVFRINGQWVREKDLKEFLAAAGIYENAYNVVLQGDVVRFVKMTPVERRKLIEEISGVGEYEEKKQKALADLGDVELRIRELRLLMDELEVHMEKLKEEVRKLEEYRELEERRRELQIKLLVKEAQQIKTQLETIESKEKVLREELASLRQQEEEKQGELNLLEEKLKELREKLLPHREMVGRLSQKLESISNRLQQIARTKEELLDQRTTLERQLEHLKHDADRLRIEKEDLAHQLIQREEELTEDEVMLEELQKTLQEKESFLKASFGELESVEERIKKLEGTLRHKKDQLSQLEIKIKDIQLRIERLEEELQNTERELESLKEGSKDSVLQKENFIQMLQKEEQMVILKKRELADLEDHLRKRREERENLLKEIAVLESKIRDLELTHLPFEDIRGVYGRVSDLIRVKDSLYIRAIEVAGGSRLSYVIVEDEDVAQECIRRLKELKGGRMSFIPLKRIRDVQLPPYPRVRGYVDFAIRLVEYDPRVEKAIKFVFGDTLVVEDYERAKAIGIGLYRMVTLEGELFEKSGIITGGYTDYGGYLGAESYRRKLEELLKRKERDDRALVELEEKVSTLRKEVLEKEGVIHILRRKIEELQERDKETFEKIKQLEIKLAKGKEYMRHLVEQEERLLLEKRSLEEEIPTLREKLDNLVLRRSDILQHYRSSGIEELRQHYERERKRIERKREEIFSLKLKLQQLEAEIQTLEKEIGLREVSLEEVSSRWNSLEEEEVALITERDRLEEQLRELNSTAYEMYRRKDALEDELRQLTSFLGMLRMEREKKEEELHQMDKEKVRWEERYEEIKGRLRELGFEGEGFEVQESFQKLRDQLQKLQSKLEALGSINMKAEEDYREYKERHQEYQERYSKLKEEKESIIRLIEELDTKKLKAFMSAYNSINRNLRRIFSQLSPGGTAYMVLEKEEDPLSGGIHLVVKPRGKEVQYLEAISGGEKTLAALSLIFAIQEYRPSIFYYFDEVDAHLDEVNARRVGELIRERSSYAQFIVVTLREVLASYAHRLIGVSSRGGTSRVFPLRNITQMVGSQELPDSPSS